MIEIEAPDKDDRPMSGEHTSVATAAVRHRSAAAAAQKELSLVKESTKEWTELPGEPYESQPTAIAPGRLANGSPRSTHHPEARSATQASASQNSVAKSLTLDPARMIQNASECLQAVERRVGPLGCHVASLALTWLSLIGATAFNFMLVFHAGVFANTGDHYGGTALKFLPDQHDFLSRFLAVITASLLVAWLCFISYKVFLNFFVFRDTSVSITQPWLSNLVFALAQWLEIATTFCDQQQVFWACCGLSLTVFPLAVLCIRAQFDKLSENQHTGELWSRWWVSVLERWLGQNALAGWAALRVAHAIFYWAAAMGHWGAGTRLTAVLVCSTTVALLFAYLYVENLVLGDVSVMYLTPWPLLALTFVNAMFSNVHRGKVLELYLCSGLAGVALFCTLVKFVIVNDLRNQSPADKEKLAYMHTGHQFMLSTREGRSSRATTGRPSQATTRVLTTEGRRRASRALSDTWAKRDSIFAVGGVRGKHNSIIKVTHEDEESGEEDAAGSVVKRLEAGVASETSSFGSLDALGGGGGQHRRPSWTDANELE